MLFHLFGNDIFCIYSANTNQLNLPRRSFPDDLSLLLSSLTTRAVSLSFGLIDVAELASNIFDNRDYFFVILHSACI